MGPKLFLLSAISSLSHDRSEMERHDQQGAHSLYDHAGEEGAEAMTEPLAQEVRNSHNSTLGINSRF